MGTTDKLRLGRCNSIGRLGLDVIIFSAAISTCMNDGQWQSALVCLNVISFNTPIAACGMDGQWQSAL
eukprot:4938236-Karenia_brevis.AAC.1